MSAFYLLMYGLLILLSLSPVKFDYVKMEYMVIFGFELKPECETWVSHLGQIFMAIQLFFHIPFIYYIAKEHLLSCVDEILNQSMS